MNVGKDCTINVFAVNFASMGQDGAYFTSPNRGLEGRSGALRVISDQVSSTALVVDASGNKVSETRYYPFGEVRYTSGNSPTDKTYIPSSLSFVLWTWSAAQRSGDFAGQRSAPSLRSECFGRSLRSVHFARTLG